MQYNGNELVEMTPENWDGKSREMLVWDDNSKKPFRKIIIGYFPDNLNGWMANDSYWQHCAEIPKEELKIEIKPEYDFVENMLKAATQAQNDYIILPKRAVEQMRELEKAFGIVYEENEKLKTEVDELKNSCSYQVYSDMLKEKEKYENKIATLEAQDERLKEENKNLCFLFNDKSAEYEKLKAENEELKAERIKMADSVSSAVWKELMERASKQDVQMPVGFGFNDVSDIVLNKILEYKPEKKVRRMTNKELDEWLEQGKGVVRIADVVKNTISYDCEDRNHEVSSYYKICGYDEDTWHEPLIEE